MHSDPPESFSIDKLISLREAVAVIRPGHVVAVGGVFLARRPFGAIRHLLLGDVVDLDLVVHSVGIDVDVLVADRRVRSIRHIAVQRGTLGPPPAFTQALGDGRLEIRDETTVTLGAALRASMAGVPFLPLMDTGAKIQVDGRSDRATICCPFSGERVVAVPALRPDVAVVHAHAGDRAGNLWIQGPLGLDAEFVFAANYTIATVEKVVDGIEGAGRRISGAHVDAIVELPRGAFPSACLPSYRWDLGFTLAWYDAVREGRGADILERMSVRSYDEFLATAGLRGTGAPSLGV